MRGSSLRVLGDCKVQVIHHLHCHRGDHSQVLVLELDIKGGTQLPLRFLRDPLDLLLKLEVARHILLPAASFIIY